MLRDNDQDLKTYEERIAEAISGISVYSDEWTNYNPSEPGITVLENLSLFNTLQQEHIREENPAVKAALLKMAGFVPARGKCARVLLAAEGCRGELEIPRGQIFQIGDVRFETIKSSVIGRSYITDICLIEQTQAGKKQLADLSMLIDSEIPLHGKIFGKTPKAGNEVLIFCNELPEASEEIIFYFVVRESADRNAFEEKEKDLFAKISWQVYTEQGFVAVHSKDNTNGFLTSGEVHLRMPQEKPAVYRTEEFSGCCIRAVLEEASYDEAPTVQDIFAFLTEAFQQNTVSFSYSGTQGTSMSIRSDLTMEHYISVFGKEEKGSSYHQYLPAPSPNAIGRYYETEEKDGEIIYHFDRNAHGFAPMKGRGAVRVIGYNEQIMRRYSLGMVEGYDDQSIDLPVGNIVAESFFVIARRDLPDGEKIYDFVRPGRSGEGNLDFVLYEKEGRIVIRDAGDYIGAQLLMGRTAVYRGEAGNVLENSTFIAPGLPSYIRFFNPGKAQGGQFSESLESVRKRFVSDLDTPFAAVTEQDYENLALSTPGLCIGKVRAYLSREENKVLVAVLPSVEENERPVLSEDYRRRIFERLDERRLLTTRVDVRGPIYAKVDVSAVIYIRKHYSDAEQQIRKVLLYETDYVHSEHNFSQPLIFEDVFRSIEQLPCVAYVYQLKMRPEDGQLAAVQDESIYPIENVLLIPGNIHLELVRTE